jgi:hypothetical protein
VLPLRVTPVPGESFDSWLEACCRRLGIPIGVLATGLGIRGRPAAARARHLPAGGRRRAGARRRSATGPTPGDDPGRYHPHVVQIDPDRQAVTRSVPWTRRRGSRFCPVCLTERDGRWPLRWRLSWVFACTEHAMLLHDTCPACAAVPRQFLLTRQACTRQRSAPIPPSAAATCAGRPARPRPPTATRRSTPGRAAGSTPC